jgi:hypothetical protein
MRIDTQEHRDDDIFFLVFPSAFFFFSFSFLRTAAFKGLLGRGSERRSLQLYQYLIVWHWKGAKLVFSRFYISRQETSRILSTSRVKERFEKQETVEPCI